MRSGAANTDQMQSIDRQQQAQKPTVRMIMLKRTDANKHVKADKNEVFLEGSWRV
jgi:hypothetical protein